MARDPDLENALSALRQAIADARPHLTQTDKNFVGKALSSIKRSLTPAFEAREQAEKDWGNVAKYIAEQVAAETEKAANIADMISLEQIRAERAKTDAEKAALRRRLNRTNFDLQGGNRDGKDMP